MAYGPLDLPAGTLKHAITISAPTGTRDAEGQMTSSWTVVLETRAAILSTASNTFRDSFQGNVLAANATDLITIRYPAVSITPGMQVAFGDQLYTIQAVDDVQRRHRKLNLACLGLDTGSGY